MDQKTLNHLLRNSHAIAKLQTTGKAAKLRHPQALSSCC